MFLDYLELLSPSAEKEVKKSLRASKQPLTSRSNKTPWKLKSSTIKDRKRTGHAGSPILVRSGTLVNGITFKVHRNDYAIDITNKGGVPSYKKGKGARPASEYSVYLDEGMGKGNTKRPHLVFPKKYLEDGSKEKTIWNKIFGANFGKFERRIKREVYGL